MRVTSHLYLSTKLFLRSQYRHVTQIALVDKLQSLSHSVQDPVLIKELSDILFDRSVEKNGCIQSNRKLYKNMIDSTIKSCETEKINFGGARHHLACDIIELLNDGSDVSKNDLGQLGYMKLIHVYVRNQRPLQANALQNVRSPCGAIWLCDVGPICKADNNNREMPISIITTTLTLICAETTAPCTNILHYTTGQDKNFQSHYYLLH